MTAAIVSIHAKYLDVQIPIKSIDNIGVTIQDYVIFHYTD